MDAAPTTHDLPYRGRVAPSPTGLLHLGHACTFWTAYQRALQHQGSLVFRNEDLDPQRSKPGYVQAMLDDLHWLGIRWQEGPDVGGPFAPYEQSRRREHYLAAWRGLRDAGVIYPCTCSRKDLAASAAAPNEGDDEPLYSGHCREKIGEARNYLFPKDVNWRFRVPDGEPINFHDLRQGAQRFVAREDFGDFVVWRRDDVPAYQLAVVADDAAMQITEVVRGADLLKSTARQLLLIRALQMPVPAYYHCDLVRDERGARLAKRHDSLSLRTFWEQGHLPQDVLEMCRGRGSKPRAN
jgi:glutamyl/glutaminyl-tRNA synthetase